LFCNIEAQECISIDMVPDSKIIDLIEVLAVDVMMNSFEKI